MEKFDQLSLFDTGQEPDKGQKPDKGQRQDNSETQLKAAFSFAVFKSSANGFCVYICRTEDQKKITVTGYFLPDKKDVKYIFHGKYVKDPKYGDQFQASSFEEVIEQTQEGIIAWLSSGILKGVGKKTAQKIYDHFGQDSLDILENQPERLREIKGITKKKLEQIVQSYAQSYGLQKVVQFLLPYNITHTQARHAFQMGLTTAEQIRESPYRLCEIRGVTFPDADRVARSAGIDPLDNKRLFACARYVLRSYEKETGSVCMDKDLFGKRLLENLENITPEQVLSATCRMIREKELYYRKVDYYDGRQMGLLLLPDRYNMEESAAKMFAQIKTGKMQEHPGLKDGIEQIAQEKRIQLDAQQKTAILTAVENPVTVITGGPGTGKTTIQEIIVRYLEKNEPDRAIVCIAPTGMAARRLTQVCHVHASTIHSLLTLRAGDPDDLLNQEELEPIEDTTIILDEVSMVDIYLFYTLLRAVGENCRLILVGDAGQLPSVGPGAVLRDIMLSGIAPVIRLKNVFRQAKGSHIYETTKKINEGGTGFDSSEEFTIYPLSDLSTIQDRMVRLYLERVNQYGPDDVFVLCPYRKYPAGVDAMNNILQQNINPPAAEKAEYPCKGQVFRVGDRVMNLVNSDQVVNGDIGIIENIVNDGDNAVISVRFFGDTLVTYDGENIEKLSLAYAITVHKAQGSEAACVITCLTGFHRRFLFRNFPNTAISRGKEHVDFLGDTRALEIAARTMYTDRRLSLFWYHLKAVSGEFIPVHNERLAAG